jgi:hypothetical protein
MRFSSGLTLALAASALIAGVALQLPVVQAADWQDIEFCEAPLEGAATGTGVLGRGSAKARIVARANWEDAAARTYGPKFANLSRAKDVRWDCKDNAILLAKCVVVAKPCSARLRG